MFELDTTVLSFQPEALPSTFLFIQVCWQWAPFSASVKLSSQSLKPSPGLELHHGAGGRGHVHSCMGWSTSCNGPIADRNQGCFSCAHLQEAQQPLMQFSTLSILLWAQAPHKWSPRSLYPLSVLPPVQFAKSIHLLCFKLQGWGTQNMTPTTHFQRGSPPT